MGVESSKPSKSLTSNGSPSALFWFKIYKTTLLYLSHFTRTWKFLFNQNSYNNVSFLLKGNVYCRHVFFIQSAQEKLKQISSAIKKIPFTNTNPLTAASERTRYGWIPWPERTGKDASQPRQSITLNYRQSINKHKAIQLYLTTMLSFVDVCPLDPIRRRAKTKPFIDRLRGV